ncbi:hypothetical protein [Massilia sp. TWP1-3-3]|uniref:hypothetical protein n=1 Tax=Massilia sp. TWP1-3-3 TaxID=2804573 RepID=UPI003CF73566
MHAAAPGTPILTLHETGNDDLAASAVQQGARGTLLKGNYQHNLLPLAIDVILAHNDAEATNARLARVLKKLV